MCQDLRRQEDGRILLGTNVVTREPYVITLGRRARSPRSPTT